MLAKAPEDRPTMREVARRLEMARGELEAPVVVRRFPAAEPTSSDSEVIAPRRRPIWPIFAGTLAIAAALVLAAVPRRPAVAPEVAPPPVSAVSAASPAPVAPASPATPVMPPAEPAPRIAARTTVRDEAATTAAARRDRAMPRLSPACPDPGVLRVETRWYMTCTGGGDGNLYPIFESTNLASWRRAGWIFAADAPRPAWGTGNYWAPELHPTPTGFAAYFSMRNGTKNAIGVATASSVLGPYTDAGAPLLAPARGASDAHVLIDTGGSRYLYYKLEGKPGSIWVHELSDDGLSALPGSGRRLLAATEPWEQGVVEAPWVHHQAGFYYLFYSAAQYCDASYAVGVARSTSPLGPFEKLPRPIAIAGAQWVGPGHVAITTGPDDRLYLVHHAYQLADGTPTCAEGAEGDNNQRRVRVDRLVFEHGWPRVIAQPEP
jgi:beta-xylosidase